MINHQLKSIRDPLPHQLRGMEAMIRGIPGFCNNSEMGTGKTLMVIGAMNHLNVERALIVCPNSLKYNWKQEFEFSELPWDVYVLEGTGTDKEGMLEWLCKTTKRSRKAVITNYDSLARIAKNAKAWNPQVIVADESHAIKDSKTKRSKALKSIGAQVRWALTGTPVLNNPMDVWSMVDWVRPGHLNKNFYAFRARYADVYSGAGFPIIKGYRNQAELKKLVDQVSFRVTKAECLDLPEKTWVERTVELNEDEKLAYKQMAKDMIAWIKDEAVEASIAMVKMLRLTQITSGFLTQEGKVHRLGFSKVKELEALLDELEDKKVVVFAHFKEEIRSILALLETKKRKAFSLSAEMSAEERQDQVNSFQACSEPAVIVMSTTLGGVGINLTSASHCVYFSNNWSQGDRLQSQDRLHRMGQKNPVNYYDLVVPGSVDSYILKVLKNKHQLADNITGDSLRQILFDKD